MVDELKRRDVTVYVCELCGFGYEDVDTAERCEQYCNTHGVSSPEITRKAAYKPHVRVISAIA